jgi:hypothetical protein
MAVQRLGIVVSALVICACTGGKREVSEAPDGGSPPVATAPDPSPAGVPPDAAPPPSPPDAVPAQSPPDAGPVLTPPVTKGHWTYYATSQGLSADVRDVSADEGGNVYVAGTDALYVKGRAGTAFDRFDADNAGLSKTCNDPADANNDFPTKPFFQCPVISVAGAAPGKAVVGFDGFDLEFNGGAEWALHTGGADVIAFDPDKVEVSKIRHVYVASPPHVICGVNGEEFAAACSDPNDPWWIHGRRLFRRVFRIVVNHDTSSAMYGDAWLGGNHATFSVLLNDTASRGWVDPTAGFGPNWVDAKDVWEHLHPAILGIFGEFLLGAGYALSIDPRTGIPWGSNGIRTTSVAGYGPDLSNPKWGMAGAIDFWPDSGDPWSGPTNDNIRSISHCPDGTLWVGSLTHGLARVDPAGAITYLDLPSPATDHDSVTAVACDPTDSSLWIGLGSGGVLRLQSGTFQPVDTAGVPAFADLPVASIQIDRWASTRILYFAFGASKDGAGQVLAGGGVASYDGP